ncbi:reverse transcriptase domain-containing protein [Tanacetum coccineum]
MKAITTRSGVAYEGPSIPTNLSPKKVVERETKETTDKEQTNFQGSTTHIPPMVNPIPILEPDVPKTLPKPNIFFADALLLMPRFAATIKSLLMNKEKLLELAKILLNENYSVMLLKKLGGPGKFLIQCTFPGMDVCHALTDLGASINLMPLSIWKKISLPEFTPTRMTLELADRSITHPKGLAKDVYVKVGKFHFPTDFVVVDFEAVVYAFEKFWPYLVLSKSIVYTDHSALKYLMNKQDAKPRLLRLENPHKDVLENKDINENFPLETLGVISSGSTPWFADYANFHAGNFIIKGMTTQQKKKFFKNCQSITRPKGVAEDVFVKVGKSHFPTDFVVVDFEADPRVPLILGRSFLRIGRTLIDVYEGELILRDGDERLIFHVDKHPQKYANHSIKMINFIDVSCEDSFREVLRLKKSKHFWSGSTTPLFNSRPSLISFEISDSLLEEFTDELALLNPFPPGNEDVDFKADLREIELLFNHDPSTNFSHTIMIDPNPKRFTDELALACLPPPGDDNSFLKEDVQEEMFQIYSNPLFEFDDNYNSSDINPLFKEILEDVKGKDSNVSNIDEDECFDPGGEIDKINAFMNAYNDSEGDVLEILHNTIHNLFPKVFFDHEPQGLKDEHANDDLMIEDKVFDLGVIEKFFFPSYVRLSSKDCHYLFFTIVFSFGSEDTIFYPGISAFHFSSLEPVAFKYQMEVCFSTCFIPKDE